MKKSIILALTFLLTATIGLNAQEYHLGQVVTNPDGSQGVVFYLNEDGTSGWMVALHDAALAVPWGLTDEIEGLNHVINTNNDILTSAFSDTDGYSNTLAILNHYQSTGYIGQYAATQVDIANGWYLPAAGQLKMLYVNAIFYEPTLASIGEKLGLHPYWSSTQENTERAWYVHFGSPYPEGAWAWNAYISVCPKTNTEPSSGGYFAVRAIRNLEFSPLPFIAQLQTPAVICGEGSIEPVMPNLHNANSYGWEISQDEAFTHPLAYTGQSLDVSFNGWYLRLWATNEEGTSYSNVVRISVHETSETSTMISSCEPYTWNGITYTESGVYHQTLISTQGCDSTLTLYLTIGHQHLNNQNTTVCDSYIWNGIEYTESGVYEQTFTSAQGCDSTVILNLTIRASSPVSPIHGNSLIYYQTSGTYTYSIDPVPGCFGYEWSLDGPWSLNASSDSPECTININVSGTATLKVKVYTECGFIERSLYINHDVRPDVTIYPNPTHGDFNILLSGMEGVAVIIIYDCLGQYLGSFSVDTDLEGTTIPYSLSGKAAGLYFVRVINNYNTITKKVIKDKPATYSIHQWWK